MSSSDRKLEKGDRVIYKITANEGEWAEVIDPCVKEDASGQVLLVERVKIKLLNNTKLVIDVYENDLVIPPKGIVFVNTKMLLCNCGLKYVRDGGKHSHWCLLYGRE